MMGVSSDSDSDSGESMVKAAQEILDLPRSIFDGNFESALERLVNQLSPEIPNYNRVCGLVLLVLLRGYGPVRGSDLMELADFDAKRAVDILEAALQSVVRGEVMKMCHAESLAFLSRLALDLQSATSYFISDTFEELGPKVPFIPSGLEIKRKTTDFSHHVQKVQKRLRQSEIFSLLKTQLRFPNTNKHEREIVDNFLSLVMNLLRSARTFVGASRLRNEAAELLFDFVPFCAKDLPDGNPRSLLLCMQSLVVLTFEKNSQTVEKAVTSILSRFVENFCSAYAVPEIFDAALRLSINVEVFELDIGPYILASLLKRTKGYKKMKASLLSASKSMSLPIHRENNKSASFILHRFETCDEDDLSIEVA